MKHLKKIAIHLFLLAFMSTSAHAWGSKKRPPQAFNIEVIQLYVVELFK